MSRDLLTRPMMHALVESEPWRQYLAHLVDEFEQIEARYDTTPCSETLRGLKMGVRAAIETPYAVAGVASPLTRTYGEALKPLGRKRRTQQEKARPAVPLPVPLRRSGLV